MDADHGHRNAWLYALALLGSFNLALGILLALWQSARADDLRTIHGWCHQWLYGGVSLYEAENPPDYPPNAIVTYAALATVPLRWLVTVWAMTTLALTPLLPYAVMRSASPHLRIRASIVPTVLFVCWGGARTVLQFSQLSFLMAFAPLSMPQHWIVGGIFLGLALAKPHIAGPIALWAACRRRVGVTWVAVAVVVVEYGVYCWRIGETALSPISGWIRGLRAMYSGADARSGYTSIRPWALALTGNQAMADALWIAISGIGLIALCLAALRDRTKTLAIPGLLCLWSLLTVYHNLNNLAILALPAFIFLLTVDDPDTRPQRVWAVGIIQASLMLGIPIHLRSLAGGPLGRMIADADRMLVVGTFVLVAWCWRRLQRAAVIGDTSQAT
jgi:hypothetical protein